MGMGQGGWGNGGRQQGCCQAHWALRDRLCLSVHPSERLNIQFVSAQSRTGLLTAQEAQHVQQLHEENRRFLRIPRRWVMLGWAPAEVVGSRVGSVSLGTLLCHPCVMGGGRDLAFHPANLSDLLCAVDREMFSAPCKSQLGRPTM